MIRFGLRLRITGGAEHKKSATLICATPFFACVRLKFCVGESRSTRLCASMPLSMSHEKTVEQKNAALVCAASGATPLFNLMKMSNQVVNVRVLFSPPSSSLIDSTKVRGYVSVGKDRNKA